MQSIGKFLLLFLIFTIQLLKAQDYSSLNYNNLGAYDGLPSEECRFVFQDSRDFLWIGTEEGLIRYDGYDLINLSKLAESELSNIFFTDATEDPNNHLWFSSKQGIYHLNPYNYEIKHIQPGQYKHTHHLSNNVTSIVCDGDSNIWFGGPSGLFKYQVRNDSLQHYQVNSNQNQNNSQLVKKLLFTSKNELWLATWENGIVKYNKSKDQLEYQAIPNHNIINEFYEDNRGNLWVARWNKGISVIDISDSRDPEIIKKFSYTPTSRKATIPDNVIHSFVNDKYGNIWIGTPYGLVIIEKPYSDKPTLYQKEHHSEKESLSNNIVRDIFLDRSGIIWVSTGGGGIDKIKIHSPQFRTRTIPELDPHKKSQTIHCFTHDNKGRFLIGVQGLGFLIYIPETNRYLLPAEVNDYEELSEIGINTVKSFLWDNDSNLWIGTRFKGLIKYNPGTGNMILLNPETKNQLFMAKMISSLRHGNYNNIWAATPNGLYRIVNGPTKNLSDFSVKRFNYIPGNNTSLPSNDISDVIIDDEGYLWTATYQSGIARSITPLKNNEDEINFRSYRGKKRDNKMETDHIMTLFKDSKGELWVGTGGKGIKKWDLENEHFYSPFEKNMMDGYIIYAINESDDRKIWATSNKGLIRLTPDSSGYATEFFSSRDGLQGDVFLKNSFYKTSNGHFLIGGHKGYNTFDPANIAIDEFEPSIEITSLNVSGQIKPPHKFSKESPLILTHNDKYVSFSFASLDFRMPEKNRYAYKLEGFEQGWQYVDHNTRSATYANLKPGNYKFIVKGTNSKGKWIHNSNTIPIRVKRAPYATWAAFTGYIIIITGLVGLFIYLYTNNIKISQALRIEHIEKEKTAKLTQFKLQFFTNLSHELLTPLAILNILANRWDSMVRYNKTEVGPILERNVSRLSRLVNQVLQFRKSETGNMRISVKEINILSYVQEIYHNYKILAKERNISFNLIAPHELWGTLDPEILDIVLNNLLSNAFKFTSEGGEIALTVKTVKKNEKDETHWLNIQVKDNGRGISDDKLNTIFERFYQIGNVNTKQKGIGIGLALTKNLINMHDGSIDVESVPGQGTVFSFLLPISTNFYRKYNETNNQILIDSRKISNEPKTVDEEKKKGETIRPQHDKTILLVEDNEDFLALLKNDIGIYFSALEATNASEALKLAEKEDIDLILSDVMMDGMSGQELCYNLKNNINTSHIPIILLTAAQEDIERLKGYEAGADSFLTKPVMPEVLIKRIELLLGKREERKFEFNTGQFLEPENTPFSSHDQKILEKAKAIVEREINNPELTVKTLRDEIGLSNSMLYRKIKFLLNLTPNEFIRTIRLRRAAQLLDDNAVNVSEAAYNTGFNDLSYFGVCFKRQYGVTPTTYLKNAKKDKTK